MTDFPPVAQRFFFLYSRMEYALKRVQMVNRDASANWDHFARQLGRRFFRAIVESGDAAYLIANPPRKQIVLGNRVLDWQETGAVSNAASLFNAIRTARNNLFHGGKFPRGYLADSARDEQLLTECILVLEAALGSHDDVRMHFSEGE